MNEKGKRGFASMDPEKRREIARKGGNTISQNSQHMSDIGRRGGEASGRSRQSKPKSDDTSKDGSSENE